MLFLCGILMAISVCGDCLEAANVSQAFITYELVPDILSVPPSTYLEATFQQNDQVVSLGNELPLEATKEAPSIKWDAEDNSYYTVMMVDPDAPSHRYPTLRSVIHWFVLNVQNGDVTTGDSVMSYTMPAPTPGLGPHRYTLLVYRQEGKIEDDFSFFNIFRLNFSVKHFASYNHLGDPVAGNFFQTQIKIL